MDYSQAKRIRQTGFSNLWKENLIDREQGVFKSLRQTISERSSARWKGMKEAVDPMNIVRFAFGGSNLAAAIYGRMMGRSQSDISYFARGKKAGAAPYSQKATATKIQPLESHGSLGAGGLKLLENIYQLMTKSNDEDVQFRETERSFREERENEEQKRHDQLVKAIREYGGAGSKTKETETSKGGIFDSIFKMFSSLKDTITGMFESLSWKSLVKFIKSPIFGFLAGPLAMVGGILALAELLDWAVKMVPDYSKPSPSEALAALQNGTEYDIEKLGGRAYLQNIVNQGLSMADEAKATLADTSRVLSPQEKAAYEKLAGFSDEYAKYTTEQPRVESQPTQLGNVPARPDTTGGKNMERASNWDRKFGETHNPDGTPKVQTQAKPLPSGVEPNTAAAGQSSADMAATDPRRLDLPTGAAFGITPHGIKQIPTPPDIGRIIDENNNLKMEEEMKVIEPPPPIVNTSSNSNSVDDRPIGATASQRDDVAILNRVLDQSRALI